MSTLVNVIRLWLDQSVEGGFAAINGWRTNQDFCTHVRTRAQMLDAVWGRNIYVEERTVDVHVGRLHKIPNKNSDHDRIRTLRGTGYAFDERI